MEAQPIVQLENITRRFPVGKGEFTALNKISLNFRKGEFAGLAGPAARVKPHCSTS